MARTFLRTKKWASIAALIISACAMTGCVESTFNLASESRLPGWFTTPPGLRRADVSVTLDYYSMGSDEFILRNNKGEKLTMVNGRSEGQSRPYPTYSDYEVATANGITEVIRLRPYKDNENMVQNGKIVALFYVIDDPALRNKVLAARGLK